MYRLVRMPRSFVLCQRTISTSMTRSAPRTPFAEIVLFHPEPYVTRKVWKCPLTNQSGWYSQRFHTRPCKTPAEIAGPAEPDPVTGNRSLAAGLKAGLAAGRNNSSDAEPPLPMREDPPGSGKMVIDTEAYAKMFPGGALVHLATFQVMNAIMKACMYWATRYRRLSRV